MSGKSNTDIKYMEVVLGRVDKLDVIIHHHLETIEHAKFVRACLSEALTFAMQLDLLESVKATEIGAKADDHICQQFNLSHGALDWTLSKSK